jgi:hypothetical protein
VTERAANAADLDALFAAEWRLAGDGVAIPTDGWTQLELAAMDGLRWWPLDELRRTDEVIYPPDLGDRVAAVLAHGWDGATPLTE